MFLFFLNCFCYRAIDSAKMACVRADLFFDFFKIQKIDFANKSHFKGIFGLKTLYVAYKPILDSLF